jgi:hypothetical protein
MFGGHGFSYIKLRFSLNGGYAKLHHGNFHLIIRLAAYNYDKIIVLHSNEGNGLYKNNYIICNIKLSGHFWYRQKHEYCLTCSFNSTEDKVVDLVHPSCSAK